MTSLARTCLMVAMLYWVAPAGAHEVRPALLQITETADHGYHVLWKRPLMGEAAVRLVPHLGRGWLAREPATLALAPGYALESWVLAPDDAGPLAGQEVFIEGLEHTITDALVIVRRADGTVWQGALTPVHPSLRIGAAAEAPGSLPVFVALGLEHILTGVDHLLFVLGLLLLIDNRWMLLKTITAFTLAHSLTLAMATLGVARPPVPFIEAAIALSILFLGCEILRRYRGETSLTMRQPWVVAFLFGLLHGFGFASGLAAVGLPRGDVPLALLLFNIGVEIGQLGFVTLLLCLAHALRLLPIRWSRALQLLPAYAVGSLGAWWTLQRIIVIVAPSS